MRTWNQWAFQDALSAVIEEFLFFNDFSLIILSFITTFVFIIILKTLGNKFIRLNLLEGQLIECIWTLIPAIILIQVAIPSLTLLYLLDETLKTQISIKVIGHQWYWSYEFSDLWRNSYSFNFDSYIQLERTGNIRLLDVDNRVTLPFNVSTRVLVRSADVLHSWAIPPLGIKIDASPGRLNQVHFIRYRPGVFFGQCSEICGANHRFIPITIEFILSKDFWWWVSNI